MVTDFSKLEKDQLIQIIREQSQELGRLDFELSQKDKIIEQQLQTIEKHRHLVIEDL